MCCGWVLCVPASFISDGWPRLFQMEIQREKNRVVELTNETKKFNALKKVSV